MTDESDPYQPPTKAIESGAPGVPSISVTWIAFYVAGYLWLFFTTPLMSHSNSWSGVFPGFCILMFGAYRLAVARARYPLIFIYGCGTSFIFAYRFVSMDRFSLWLNQAPSTVTLLVIWCVICLVDVCLPWDDIC